jgi:hypothetical protein
MGKTLLPKELTDAFRRCSLIVGDEQLEYFYQLYDPETGGFYYSISSRDAEEMTPFAEGTLFALDALRSGGIELPEWYKEKVSKWILGHQDESDGFFYEDLWGKTTSGPRQNRDLIYSNMILRYCGVKPKYMLPADRIKSKVESSSLPEYLESRESMTAYLDSLDWSVDSIWKTGQKLSTAYSLIKAAGYYELVYEYIKGKQNKETALFGEGLSWMNTNGAMKLSAFFCEEGHPYPNAELAIESVIKIYSGEIAPSSGTYIWNPFVLLDRIINAPGADSDRLRRMLLERGAEIVNRAIDCALKLKKPDGGFASGIKGATPRQQGYLFGYGFADESDLDGTLLVGERLYTSLHTVFGIEPDRSYYKDRNCEFWERCRNKEKIKKVLPRPDESVGRGKEPVYRYEENKINTSK